jgi:glycosyltransferase involved in cell wall biosynthesis
MPDPVASVIVPARDAEDTLPRTLEALRSQSHPGFEVIVVDDGSRDRTASVAQQFGAPVQVLRQRSQGPAAARNLGVRHATGQVLAFCDADVFPAAGWLQAGVAALDHAEIVQGQLLPDPTVPLGPFDRTIWVSSAAGLWETANLFVRRELFVRVGGFEEWLRPRRGKALAEDVWFGYRARRLGARSGYCPDALAYHAVFPRGWLQYVSERRRLQYFPAMAGKMPELRTTFLYRRMFLNRRSARFDLCLAGAALAFGSRSRLPLAMAAPYLRVVQAYAGRGRPVGTPPALVALADVAADTVGLIAMACGSVRYRSVVV